MNERRNPHRLHLDRLAALCREVEWAVTEAATSRATAREALDLLIEAQRKSTQLCEEVDRLLTPVKPRARRSVKGRGHKSAPRRDR